MTLVFFINSFIIASRLRVCAYYAGQAKKLKSLKSLKKNDSAINNSAQLYSFLNNDSVGNNFGRPQGIAPTVNSKPRRQPIHLLQSLYTL